MNEKLKYEVILFVTLPFQNYTSLIYYYSYNVRRYVLTFFTHL